MFHIYIGHHNSSVYLLLLLLHLNSIVYVPPPPEYFCFPSLTPPPHPPQFYCLPPPPFPQFWVSTAAVVIKGCNLLQLPHSMIMIRVVRNNQGFLQLLADCPSHQCQFLLKTATLQQMHELVQILYNVLTKNIPVSEEDKRKLMSYKDALFKLAQKHVPFETKKQVLIQEGGGLIK